MQAFLPFLLILFLIAAAFRVDSFFTIVYLLFAVYLLSRIWIRHTAGRLRAKRHFVNRAFAGDRVPVKLTVHNASWLPVPWLEMHESLPVALTSPPYRREVVTLGPHERHRLHYTLDCRTRGYYLVGPLTMQTGDLLGLVRKTSARLAPEYIIVYPRVVPLRQLSLPTHAPQAALPAPTALFEDPARVMGVRDYQRGDSPRHIHWTATASAAHLLVKRYQPAIARETLICLDLDRDDYGDRQRYAASELAIVIAASIANHIITKEGLPAGLATEAWDPLLSDRARFHLPPRSERAHLMSLLEVLARVQITQKTSFVELLRRECMHLSWGATLAIITGCETEALFDTLAYLRRVGLVITLILVQPARTPAELRGRGDLLGLQIHRLWQEEDLEALQ